MKCDICKKENATIHLTEIVNNKITEIHVCDKCAQEKGIETEKIKSSLNMTDLLTSLIPEKSSEFKKEADSKISLQCSFCNLTYIEFRRKGKFGCAKCYDTFKEYIAPVIKKLHGSSQHLGKVPVNLTQNVRDKYSEIKNLKVQLMESIKKEEYERAAEIRDKIKKISSGEKI